MRFEVTTLASPEQVLRALTDFSDRRPEIWRRTLDPRTYEVRELGDTWAVARESTSGSPFLGRQSLRLGRPHGHPHDGGGGQLGRIW